MQIIADPDANPLAVIVAIAFAMYFSLPYLSFRPVTFAIVLLALCAWLILRDRRLGESTASVWLIVPVTALITNTHFFAILVPVWIVALLSGAMFEKRNVKRYVIMLLATTFACAMTPMLPGAVRAIWQYQCSDPMLGAGVVAEFQPFWSGTLGMLSVALILGLLASMFLHRERIRTGETIWMFGSVLLLIRLGRFAPVFAPIAAAILAACLPSLEKAALTRKAVVGAVFCVLIVGSIRIGLAFPRSNTTLSNWLNRHGPETPGYPCAAADFVASKVQPQSKKLINEFSWGGYLGWRLGDRYQVLLDGRTQLYTPQFWRQMYLERSAAAGALLRSCDADVAILPLHRSRFRPILIEAGWTSVYRDDRAEVLLPNRNAAHASVE
jgi:hypothetical protein